MYGRSHGCAAFAAAFPEPGNRARPADLIQAAARQPEGRGFLETLTQRVCKGRQRPAQAGRTHALHCLEQAGQHPRRSGLALPAPAHTAAMTEGTLDGALRVHLRGPEHMTHTGALCKPGPVARRIKALHPFGFGAHGIGFAAIRPGPGIEPHTAFEPMGADRHVGAPGKLAFDRACGLCPDTHHAPMNWRRVLLMAPKKLYQRA